MKSLEAHLLYLYRTFVQQFVFQLFKIGIHIDLSMSCWPALRHGGLNSRQMAILRNGRRFEFFKELLLPVDDLGNILPKRNGLRNSLFHLSSTLFLTDQIMPTCFSKKSNLHSTLWPKASLDLDCPLFVNRPSKTVLGRVPLW